MRSASTGFDICAFIPASKAAFTSFENASAVIATIGISFASGCLSCLMAFVASYPSY